MPRLSSLSFCAVVVEQPKLAHKTMATRVRRRRCFFIGISGDILVGLCRSNAFPDYSVHGELVSKPFTGGEVTSENCSVKTRYAFLADLLDDLLCQACLRKKRQRSQVF